ncbi:hypothetical protein [Brachybacterium sp. GPGPB12]|uniref:hypothetical protein n=1 Tax=Brachybacterium sp. GPGPB12 TaxID=3023517 RepID=UPI0031345915
MKSRETLHLPLPARSAAAMYADPEYAAIRRETLGANEASSHIEGDPAGAFTVTTELVRPRTGSRTSSAPSWAPP